ncbi:DMT family transporter [Photobacterium sp. GJ3]|uniref:DMT family transporter n=1 Tax=Photobacterium sp. GJ3 TaxID=2829502 RepID=UPI0020117FE2|nr:DMT family transporter [Photobacterium sp. GJ3]
MYINDARIFYSGRLWRGPANPNDSSEQPTGQYSSPLTASWIAHGVGAGFAGLVLLCKYAHRRAHVPKTRGNTPLWAYLGGIPGAFTVVLAAITVNSPLGIAGSLALMLMGQTLIKMFCNLAGVALILLGIFLNKTQQDKP